MGQTPPPDAADWAGVLKLARQAVRPLDDYRLPYLHLVDLRIQKPVSFGDFEAPFSIQCFDVLNLSTVLERNLQLGIPTTDWVQEIVNPKIFRLGVRVSWRQLLNGFRLPPRSRV